MDSNAFLAHPVLHDKLPPDVMRRFDEHVIPDEVARSMNLNGTVDQLRVINGNMKTVVSHKGRKHQLAHGAMTVAWVAFALGVIVLIVYAIVTLVMPSKPTCSNDADCGPNSKCIFMKNENGEVNEAGTCTPAFACSTSADCTGGRSCMAGFCQPTTCSATSPCLQGGALRGAAVYCNPTTHTCQAGCDRDSQCSHGLCNTTLHQCVEGACRATENGSSDCATFARCGAKPSPSDARATLAYNMCIQATVCENVAGHSLGECKIPCDADKDPCGDLGLVCDGTHCKPIVCTGTGSGVCGKDQVCTAVYAQGSAECAQVWPVSSAGEGVCVSACDIPPACGTPPSYCGTATSPP